VSSLQPEDIDLSRTGSTGVEHFKRYLVYARDGEQTLARDRTVTNVLDFDSTFEEAVYDALTDAGYDVVSQVRSANYSIDLAIKHPDRPGGSSSGSSVTERRITPRRPPETEIGHDRLSWRISAGRSTESGRRIGPPTESGNWRRSKRRWRRWLGGTRRTPTTQSHSEKATARSVAAAHGVEIASEGMNELQLSTERPWAEDEAKLYCVLLESVYGVTLDDVDRAAEHGAGYEAW